VYDTTRHSSAVPGGDNKAPIGGFVFITKVSEKLSSLIVRVTLEIFSDPAPVLQI
jgi:hypothetical protein